MKAKLWICTIFCFLIVVLFSISKTFALFETNGDANVNANIGSWNIKINNDDVTSGFVENFTMNNIIYDDSANIENGYIAPGRTGYYDLVIDATNTDVSIRYDISLDLSTQNLSNSIQFDFVDLDGDEVINTGFNVYSGIIPLEEIENHNIKTIRFYISWNDTLENDEADTNMGKIANQLEIPVSIKFSQYLAEELIQYE